MGLISWIKQGFTNAKQAKVKELEALSWCVPESIYCAWVWAVRYKDPVRLIVQSIRPGVDHVQAEAKINGEWTPLTVGWSEASHRVIVQPWHRHFGITPYRTVTLRQWIDEQIKYTEV